jgi:hypothetical protein
MLTVPKYVKTKGSLGIVRKNADCSQIVDFIYLVTQHFVPQNSMSS